jgi:hypothetical protein
MYRVAEGKNTTYINADNLRQRRRLTAPYGETQMLETIALVLVVLWVMGLASSYTMSGFIHILLVIAVIMVVLRVIQGRSPI